MGGWKAPYAKVYADKFICGETLSMVYSAWVWSNPSLNFIYFNILVFLSSIRSFDNMLDSWQDGYDSQANCKYYIYYEGDHSPLWTLDHIPQRIPYPNQKYTESNRSRRNRKISSSTYQEK